jgi:hypothetical protein
MRRVAWAVPAAVLLIGCVLLIAAGARPGTPLSPAQAAELDLAQFRLEAGGQKEFSPRGLAVEGADGLGRTLLVQSTQGLRAAEYSRLGYRFEAFPAELKLALVWRTEEEPSRMQSLPLPRPGLSSHWVRLDEVEGWSDGIAEIGLLVMTADLLPSESTLARRFELSWLRLESASLRGDLAALQTDVRAYRPWVGRSINTAGYELAIPQRHALVAPVAALVLLLGAALAIAFPVARWRSLAACLLLGWLILDLQQLAQLFWRGDFTRRAHSLSDEVQVEPRFNAALEQVRPVLRAAEPRLVLVGGALPFHRTYGAFRLLPLPASAIDSAPVLSAEEDRIAVVLVGNGDWRFDASSGTLHWSERSYPARLLFEQGGLVAFMLQGNSAGSRP